MLFLGITTMFFRRKSLEKDCTKGATQPRTALQRPAGIQLGQWLGDIVPPPTPAERKLIAASVAGQRCKLDLKRPRLQDRTIDNTIRATIIRFLVLGGDSQYPTHQRGVTLSGAWIDGPLDLKGCEAKAALRLLRCYFDREINVMDARLPGLYLSGSVLPRMCADRVQVGGSLFLRNGFYATGHVQIVNAIIGGDFNCRGGRFHNPKGFAISAARIKVEGNVFLNQGFRASGIVTLHGARINGILQCSGGKFTGHGDRSIQANRMIVNGSAYFKKNFVARGAVSLLGSSIGSNLECSGGKFENPTGEALGADGIKVVGDVFLDADFVAHGEVRLLGAEIGGHLDCAGGEFNAVGSESGTRALNLQCAYIAGALMLHARKPKPGGGEAPRGCVSHGAIDLTAARIGTLADTDKGRPGELPGCWTDGRHYLDGLVYERLNGPTNANVRIQWLETQYADHIGKNDFRPQPWEQLIKVLRDMGHPHEATSVAIGKQRALRRAGKIGKSPVWKKPDTPCMYLYLGLAWCWGLMKRFLENTLHRGYEIFAGFGYKPLKAAIWSLVFVVSCSIPYYWGYSAGYFGPTNALIMLRYHEACGSPGDIRSKLNSGPQKKAPPKLTWNNSACTPPAYTSFQAFWYSADVALPVVNLGQDGDWSPLVADAAGNTLWPGVALRWLTWIEIIFGWITTLMLAAFFTNLVRRE